MTILKKVQVHFLKHKVRRLLMILFIYDLLVEKNKKNLYKEQAKPSKR